MSSEKDGLPHERIRTLQTGVVTSNADPEGLGRVKFRINGLIEPESDWAWPLGGVGGGSHRRGFYSPPALGAEVGVLFHNGDTDRPYYLTGNWGAPDGVKETPGPVGGYATPKFDGSPGEPEAVLPEQMHMIQAYETARWILVFDDRPGKERCFLEDKKTGDHVLIDGANTNMDIKATGVLTIRADGMIVIDAPQVQIGGRLVSPSNKPI